MDTRKLSDLNVGDYKPDTYSISVKCSNCGNRELKSIPKGQTVGGQACKRCGCKTLHKT